MLQDKQIALDCLMACKTSVMDLTKAALESSNAQLKQTFLQMRNQAEQSHQEIYHLAERTGGYIAAAPADHQYVNRIRNFYQQNTGDFVGTQQYSTVGHVYYQNHNNSTYQGNNGYQTNTAYQTNTGFYGNVNPLNGQRTQY